MFRFSAFYCLVIATSISLLSAQPHVFPLAGSGSCITGTKYMINSVADLKTNIADLECIFAAGKAPDAIGLGFNYGTVLLGENSVIVQPFAAPFYQGDYVVKTTCKQQTVHLGTLKVAGISVGTAPWTLAPFTEPTAAGEAPIHPAIKNIVMDFRQNVRDICPIEDATAMLNSKGFLPFKNPLLPVNCFVDIARVVGRDLTDGGIILLAKGLNNDPQMGWMTSLFYALKTFDPAVKPGFASGTPLIVPATFTYRHNGVAETLPRFGGQGLIPFIMNAKQGLFSALMSNPFVAALALKSSLLGSFEGEMPSGMTEQLLLSQLARSSLLDNLVSNRILAGAKAAHLINLESDATRETKTVESLPSAAEADFLEEMTSVEDIGGASYGRLEELYDMMKMLMSLEEAQQQQQPQGYMSRSEPDVIQNQLRSNDKV